MPANDIKSKIEELESLRSQAQRWRMFTVLAILVIMTGGVGILINAAAGLVREGESQQEFVKEFKSGLEKDVIPSVKHIGEQSLAQIKPAIESELKKLNTRAPEIGEEFMKQLDLLSQNIRKEGGKAVQDTIGKTVKLREASIRKMYPEVTEERVAALATALVEQANDHLAETSDRLFGQHIESLAKITEDLHDIQRTEVIQSDSELATWEMAMLIVDILREETKDLTTEPEAANKSKAAAPNSKETKP